MGGDQGTAGPTDQRHRLFQTEALLQQPRQQQPPQPRTRPVMQPQQPSPPQQQGFLGAGMPPQGTEGFGAVAASRAEAEAAARARAVEQMALEDARKVLNPDFKTPFSSVEDAVCRLLPYHVFADQEDDDGVDGGNSNCSSGATVTEKSSAQEAEDEMNAKTESLLAEFEKQVLTFNVRTRQHAEGFNRAEERLMLEMALFEDERRQSESVRVAIAQHHQQQQQEAARARQALARAQAAAGAWPHAQPSTPSWEQALAAAARGQGSSSAQAMTPAALMQQQQQQQEMTMTAGSWQVLAAAATSRGEGGSGEQAFIQAVMTQQLQQQQQLQKQHQQLEMMAAATASRGEGSFCGQALTPAMVMQLLHHQQQEMMAAGTWQLGGRQGYATPSGDGSSSSQAGSVQQQHPGHPGQGQAAAMALPWRSSAERSEQ